MSQLKRSLSVDEIINLLSPKKRRLENTQPFVELIKISFAKPPVLWIKVDVRIQNEFLHCFEGLERIVEMKKESGINATRRREPQTKSVLFTFEMRHRSPFFAQIGAQFLKTRVRHVKMAFGMPTWKKEEKTSCPKFKHPNCWDVDTGEDKRVKKREQEEKEVEREKEKKKNFWDSNTEETSEHVALPHCSDFDDLLGQIEEINKIDVETVDMCDKISDLVLLLSIKCRVKHVKLSTMYKVMASRPSDFLLDLASLVNSIELSQQKEEDQKKKRMRDEQKKKKESANEVSAQEELETDGQAKGGLSFRHSENTNFLFGIIDENWSYLVLGMYGRGVKRITLTNKHYQHISPEQVNLVCQEIARQQFKVFFRTTYQGPVIDYRTQGYVANEIGRGAAKSFIFRHDTITEFSHLEE